VKFNKLAIIASLPAAFKIINFVATPGDIVLLSPGAASFNMFQNEFDRGEQFKKCVWQIK